VKFRGKRIFQARFTFRETFDSDQMFIYDSNVREAVLKAVENVVDKQCNEVIVELKDEKAKSIIGFARVYRNEHGVFITLYYPCVSYQLEVFK